MPELTESDMFVIQQASNQGSNYLQRRANKKAFERSKEFYWEQWNANNEYNHPVQQRARLKEAGLNPALMYNTSGGTGTSTMGSTPTQEAPQLNAIPGGLEFAQLQLLKSQQLNMDQDTELKTVDGALKIQQTATEKLKGELTDAQRAYWETQAKNAQDIIDMNLKKDAKEIEVKDQNIAESKSRVDINYQKLGLEKELFKPQLDKINAEIKKLGLEGKYLQELKHKTTAESMVKYAEEELLRLEKAGLGTNVSLPGLINALVLQAKATFNF